MTLCKCLGDVLVARTAFGLNHTLPLKGETRQSDQISPLCLQHLAWCAAILHSLHKSIHDMYLCEHEAGFKSF